MRAKIQKILPFAGLILLFIIFSCSTDGRFLTVNNLQNIISQALITMVAATGTIFVMAHNNIDFSLGGACAASAVLAYCITDGKNLFLMFVLCIVFGIMCGLLTSVLHIKGKIPAFMAGLCIMFAGKGLAQGVYTVKTMYLTSATELANIYFYLFVLVIVFATGYIVFNYTKIGKYNKLIGSNPEAALLSGINVAKYKTIAFVISGTTVGIAAFLNVVRVGAVTYSTGTNLEIDVLLSLSLGGISMTGGSSTKMRSVIVGTLTYYILSNGMTLWGVDANLVSVVKSVVFLITVYISIDRSQKRVIV